MAQTILMVGGLGYIGSCTAHLLHELGHQIVILDKLVHGPTAPFPWAQVVKGDCGNRSLLRVLFDEYQFDAVMHFAGLIEIGVSVARPDLFYTNNVVGSLALFDAMHRHAVDKIIFSSSCAVYGNPVYVPIDEAHPCAPVNPYGKTKLAIEYALQDYAHAFGIHFVALRYFNAAGALPEHGLGESHNPETHVIPLLLRAALQHKPFTIFGSDYATSDGTCVRDYVHVSDIARAHVLALDYLSCNGSSDLFNLGTGNGCTVRTLVQSVEKIIQREVATIEAPRRPGDAAVLVAQAHKAQQILGWKLQRSDLETILRDALAWELQRQKCAVVREQAGSCGNAF